VELVLCGRIRHLSCSPCAYLCLGCLVGPCRAHYLVMLSNVLCGEEGGADGGTDPLKILHLMPSTANRLSGSPLVKPPTGVCGGELHGRDAGTVVVYGSDVVCDHLIHLPCGAPPRCLHVVHMLHDATCYTMPLKEYVVYARHTYP
jgi:hypothetical protein